MSGKGVVSTLLAIVLAATGGLWYCGAKVRHVTEMEGQVAKLNEQLGQLRGELQVALAGGANSGQVLSDAPLPGAEGVQLHTAADVAGAVKRLGAKPSAQQLASRLAEIDSWVVRPDEEAKVRSGKLELAASLRRQVRQEVVAMQHAALETAAGADARPDAPTCAEAAKRYAEAGQVLALYPMSEDKVVLDEAKALSAQQAEVANRIEVIRRQRYNQWAAQQIDYAIWGYNQKSSYWSPKKENKELIDSLVTTLGEIDPVALEPAVLELYNYVVDLTKGSISEQDKVSLAKRLTDPTIRRKTLGDF